MNPDFLWKDIWKYNGITNIDWDVIGRRPEMLNGIEPNQMGRSATTHRIWLDAREWQMYLHVLGGV